jgi:two-component system, LytTR family, sensor histidine kinase AlgZ
MLRQMLITDTLIGFISPALQLWFNQSLTWQHVIAGQVYAHAIGTLAHISLSWAFPRTIDWRAIWRWTMVFAILAAITAVGCVVALLITSSIGLSPWQRFWPNLVNSYRFGLIVSLVFGIAGAVTETLKAQLEHATRQREKAVQLATEARLSSLESRIHPHFLFNALNSICALVREDPDRAEALMVRMAALLRFSLDSNQLGVVTLGQEIEIVRGYLEIEKARFGDRLQFSIEIPSEAEAYRVPPLSIQTLVENSVKYTLPGCIAVSASVRSGALEVEVRDRGPGVDLRSIPPGHGLDLLQSRLQTIYGEAAGLRSAQSAIVLSVPCSAPISSTTKN